MVIFVFLGAVVWQVVPVIAGGSWGQSLAVVGSIVGVGWRISAQLRKFHKEFALIVVEHNTLMEDYCERTHKKLSDLPTRQRYSPFA